MFRMDDRPRVGMFHHVEAASSIDVGRNVAIGQLGRSLAAFSQRYQYRLYGSPAACAQMAAPLSMESWMSIHPSAALSGDVDGESLAIWHDADFDTYTPFEVRAQARRPFPITLLHHTLSYKELLHGNVLRLLLADTHRYDAVVCTSSAARRAMTPGRVGAD